jgi:hypothetical protein
VLLMLSTAAAREGRTSNGPGHEEVVEVGWRLVMRLVTKTMVAAGWLAVVGRLVNSFSRMG